MKVCLDFDGVIHDPYNRRPGYTMGQPVEHAKEAIEVLLTQGHQLVIHTARCREGQDREHVHQWMRFFGFPPIEIVYAKPRADLYIDDKGLRFTSWREAMADERLNGSSH